ncbi:MAG TPA: phytanoyl-CoA dioxygenase family protein [Cytophagaceae bacterium]|jgi:hypothetical protein|nr:phytanoyl-CoA dioxygenase family protein [Cytophagaceae bacterium]
MKKIIEFLIGCLFISKTEIRNFFNQKKESSSAFDHKVKEAVDHINRHGFFVVKDFYSAETCQAIIKDMEAKMTEYASKVWVDEEGADHRLFGLDRVSEITRQFYDDKFITAVMHAFLATKVEITGFTLAGKIKPAHKNLGSGGGWHRDIVFGKQFKALVYLTDTKEENGAYQYVADTHTHAVLMDQILNNNIKARQNRFSEEEVSAILNSPKYKLETITGKAGTVILTDTTGIHRGKPITEGLRYALTNYYFEGEIPAIFDVIQTV